MIKFFRIFFTVLSALCVAATVPLGIFFGGLFVLLSLLAAAVSFGIMLLFKTIQTARETKQHPKEPTGDFFHPLPRDDD